MNKRALQNYAEWAKQNLENQIEVSLKSLSIFSETEIAIARKVGDYTIIDGDQNSYSKELYEQRERLVSYIKKEGYKNVIEEAAYTWFNRIVALRFMEVHDFIPHGFRVLSNRDRSFEPEILKNISFIKNDLSLDMNVINKMSTPDKIDELYRYILFRQCRNLSNILPMLFKSEDDFLELLLPKTLLKGETFITKILEIEEDAFLDDVEIIGWLYQFYIAKTKAEIMASKQIVSKDTLPAVTQLFTPDWIVNYMVENSLGRLWLESYPNSDIKNDLKFYVDDAEQEIEVSNKYKEIKYTNIDPIDIKVIEPCCGSGHILIYVFDVLYKMYEEKGYNLRDIPSLILKNNLYGLEVDKRAAQLASFSLIMKARKTNNRFFNSIYYCKPKIMEIWDSRFFTSMNYQEQFVELNIFDKKELKDLFELIETFRFGKTIGSLLIMPNINIANIKNVIDKLENKVVPTIFNSSFIQEGRQAIKKLLRQYIFMSRKYDVMITNPPYIQLSKMDNDTKVYCSQYYPHSKTDMFAMFMETNFVKQNGFKAMVNLQNWMTGYSYTNFRKNYLSNNTFINLVHIGSNGFPEIKGEVVQTCAFVFRNSKIRNFNTTFIDLQTGDSIEKEYNLLNKNFTYYYKKCSSFSKMPSNEFSYKVSENILNAFNDGIPLMQISEAKSGVMTGKDEVFIRLWYEVLYNKISFIDNSFDKTFGEYKWFPITNGGKSIKWYGNLEVVINIQNGGFDISHFGNNTFRLREKNYYFKNACSWSTISSNNLCVRFIPANVLFGNNGPTLFASENKLYSIIGLLNCKIANYFTTLLNPTLSILIDDITKIPYLNSIDEEYVGNIVKQNIEISKRDFEQYETSWGFIRNPLIQFKNSNLKHIVEGFHNSLQNSIDILKNNEYELNKYFIEVYNLQNEFHVNKDDINITLSTPNIKNEIKALLSYIIGLIMGRYSLDVEGLAYAGGEWDSSKYITYKPDDDGIVPIYSTLGMNDSLSSRIFNLIKLVYGEDTYRANVDFIAEALGKKTNESSEETINRYLCDDFYNDHLKIYQKRPIYWMFSSGKNNAFKCLIYLHRYNEDTLARINSKYLLHETARLKNELEEIIINIDSVEGREKLQLDKDKKVLDAKYKEIVEYGQVLDHMANQYINLDLDDGVKVNYAKFQNIEIINDNGAKIKKDLLVPIK